MIKIETFIEIIVQFVINFLNNTFINLEDKIVKITVHISKKSNEIE